MSTGMAPAAAMVSTGWISYSGDTFGGETETDMQGMRMTSRMSGKRIGACE
ncbi:MAG: hypothetical protein ACLFOY_11445 [Desulfatibacillaceae bacterium]